MRVEETKFEVTRGKVRFTLGLRNFTGCSAYEKIGVKGNERRTSKTSKLSESPQCKELVSS